MRYNERVSPTAPIPTTSFKLRKARIINNKIALTDETVTLAWEALKKQLAPTGSKQAMLMLRGAKKGCYLGIMPNPYDGKPNTFRLDMHTASRNLNWLLKSNKGLAEAITELWLVEDTVWEDSIMEIEGKPDE